MIRSREISAHIVVQTQSQLKAVYKDNAETIIGNCSCVLFLGGKEKSTLKEISETLGRETIDLYNTSDTRGSQRSMGINYQKLGKELMSQVYTGDMVQGKHTNVGYKQVVTSPENWIVVRNTHEAIISRELFAKAQAVREQTAKKGKTRAAKVPYSENILRGRVFCGCCGKNFHRQRHQCGYYLYHCISNDRIGKLVEAENEVILVEVENRT